MFVVVVVVVVVVVIVVVVSLCCCHGMLHQELTGNSCTFYF